MTAESISIFTVVAPTMADDLASEPANHLVQGRVLALGAKLDSHVYSHMINLSSISLTGSKNVRRNTSSWTSSVLKNNLAVYLEGM